jgi:predicted secreted acid phosphatase
MTIRFFIIFLGIFLSPLTFAEPPNLSIVLHELKIYHDSGAYAHDLNRVVQDAHRYILKEVSINNHRITPKKLAIVLDIDETSLSNYRTFSAHQFVETKQQIHQDMLAANAQPIIPTLQLYNDAYKQDVAVFFVTGRRISEKNATIKNLKKAGYEHWTGLYLKPENYHQPSVIPFKSSVRKMIASQGYTIIASIGDQYSDLKGGYAEKTFKLPNPYYYIP